MLLGDDVSMMVMAALCGFAFVSGVLDSMVGGGGLIQIPALFSFLPNAPVATIFGTNKFSSIAGTSFSAWRYSRAVKFDKHIVLPAMISALMFSFVGARIVPAIPSSVMKPAILVLLIIVAIYTFKKKNFGLIQQRKLNRTTELCMAVLIGSLLGFYDGFFGPGTGSFLIFCFIRIFGFDFLSASATAKLVNVATNISALAYFSASHNVLYAIAIPMAIFNIIGGWIGTIIALKQGSKMIRVAFLAIICLMILKFAVDVFFNN